MARDNAACPGADKRAYQTVERKVAPGGDPGSTGYIDADRASSVTCRQNYCVSIKVQVKNLAKGQKPL